MDTQGLLLLIAATCLVVAIVLIVRARLVRRGAARRRACPHPLPGLADTSQFAPVTRPASPGRRQLEPELLTRPTDFPSTVPAIMADYAQHYAATTPAPLSER